MAQHDDLKLGKDFMQSSPEDLIELYSLQSGLAFEQLMLNKELWSEPRCAFADPVTSAGKRFAYFWMTEQGSQRLPEWWPRGALPLWCSLKPYQERARRNDLMLTLRIPKKRLLPHLYDGWLQLLEIGSCCAGLPWPAYWPTWARPQMDPFFVRPLDKGPVAAIPPSPPEKLCRQSWEVMFDLSLINDVNLAWEPTVHMVTPFFEFHDLVRFDTVDTTATFG